MATKLAPLRDNGVMFLGSGNIVHNLRYFRGAPQPFAWANRFDKTVIDKIRAGDHAALIDYMSLDDEAHLSIPTNEHYLLLLYAIATQRKDESLEIFNCDVIASISMTSVAFGL